MKPMELRSQSDLQKAIKLGYTHVMQIYGNKIWAYTGEPEDLVAQVDGGVYDDKSGDFMGSPIDEAGAWLMEKFAPLSSEEPMSKSDYLKKLIAEQLADCCSTKLPRLKKLITSPEGKERAANILFEMCSKQGIAVQTAMSHLDTDLPGNLEDK